MTLAYVYGVIPRTAAGWLGSEQVRGIGGGRVRPVSAGGVVAAVSDVPASEFDQEPLDRNIAEAEWLAPHAAAHQDVNAALLDGAGAVVPLAFGTIFRSDDRVAETLAARGPELSAALERVAGRAEWVCTLDRDRRVTSDYLARTRDAAPPSAGAGRAYLLRRKADVESSDAQRALDAEAREGFRGALAAIAEEITEEPLIEGGLAARFTVLVARERESGLRDAADAFARTWRERGYDPRLAGPWPPYRYGARVGVHA